MRAYGSWVYLKILRPSQPDLDLDVLKSGIYMPDGAGIQKIGHGRAKVVSVGHDVTDLKPDSIVAFRGYLESAFPGTDLEHCFVHIDSVDLEVLEPETHLYEV